MKRIIGGVFKSVTFVFAIIIVGLGLFAFTGSIAISGGVGDMVHDNIYYAFGIELPYIFFGYFSIMTIIEYLCSLFTMARPVYEALARSAVSAGGSTVTSVERNTLRGIDTIIVVGYAFNIILSLICLVIYPAINSYATGVPVDWSVNLFSLLTQALIISVMYALDYATGHLFAVTGIMEEVIREVQVRRTTSSSTFTPPSSNPPTGGRNLRRTKRNP